MRSGEIELSCSDAWIAGNRCNLVRYAAGSRSGYSRVNTGHDRHGATYPAHDIAWLVLPAMNFIKYPGVTSSMKRLFAVFCLLALTSVQAADIELRPSAGNGVIVSDAAGNQVHLRVTESGDIFLPGLP